MPAGAEHGQGLSGPSAGLALAENCHMKFSKSKYWIGAIVGALLLLPLTIDLTGRCSSLRLNLEYVALERAVSGPVELDARSLSRPLLGCLNDGEKGAHAAYLLGALAEGAGDNEQAITFLEQAERRDPHDPLISLRLGRLYAHSGDSESALAYWQKADAQVYWTAQGDWQRQNDNAEDAVDAYRLALQIEPEWLPARQGLALIQREQFDGYWSAEQFDLAMPLLLEAASLDPPPCDFVRLGDFSRDQGDLVAATGWYERGAEHFPAFAQYPLRLGQLAQQAGNQEDAAAYFLQAVRSEPENAQAHFLLGVANLRQGKLDQAEEALLTKNRLGPDQWGYARLGDVYLAQEGLTEAEAAYRQALLIAPDMVYAQQKLAQFRP